MSNAPQRGLSGEVIRVPKDLVCNVFSTVRKDVRKWERARGHPARRHRPYRFPLNSLNCTSLPITSGSITHSVVVSCRLNSCILLLMLTTRVYFTYEPQCFGS